MLLHVQLQLCLLPYLLCRQRMTRAEPGCTVLQKASRSSKQASARGTSKRMSEEAYSMIFCTRAWQAGELISSLPQPCLVRENMRYLGSLPSLSACEPDLLAAVLSR